MKKNTIPTFHRALASVLFIGQLLTSCGGAEVILPSTISQTQQNIGLPDEHSPSSPPIGSPSPLSIPDAQGYSSDDSGASSNSLPTYTTRKGHQIQLIERGGEVYAEVQEQLTPGFSRSTHILPVYFQKGLYPTEFSYVDVVLPNQYNHYNGYVICAHHRGLLGGMFNLSHPEPDGGCFIPTERHIREWNEELKRRLEAAKTKAEAAEEARRKAEEEKTKREAVEAELARLRAEVAKNTARTS